MQIAYAAANIADAHLFRQWLEDAGIPAFVLGEYLRGGVGELPANTEVYVWVPDAHLEEARIRVREWEAGEAAMPEEDEADAEPTAAPVARSGGYTLARGVMLLAAVVIGGALLLSWLRALAERGG